MRHDLDDTRALGYEFYLPEPETWACHMPKPGRLLVHGDRQAYQAGDDAPEAILQLLEAKDDGAVLETP